MPTNSTSLLSLSSSVVVGTVAVDVVATGVADVVVVRAVVGNVDVGTVADVELVAVDAVDVDVEGVDVEAVVAVAASVTKSISCTWTGGGGNTGLNPNFDCFLGLDLGYGLFFRQAST